MTEIPEDVMAAARKHCGLVGVTPHSHIRVICEHLAAFSILAERERCADIDRNANGPEEAYREIMNEEPNGK